MAWINEFNYDTAGTDTGEFIEIIGRPGEDLSGYSIVRYNGSNGTAYTTPVLTASPITTLADGFTARRFEYPTDGLQNGSPDSFALVGPDGEVVVDGGVTQFLSYEGTMTAVGGAADGLTSIDVGVAQTNTTPVGSSLQLIGTGNNYADFTWAETGSASPGAVNVGQTFQSPVDPNGPPVYSIAVSPVSVLEGEEGAIGDTFTYTVLREGDASQAGSVAVTFAGTADGSDYTVSGLTDGRVTFAADATSATFTVTVTPDDEVEPNETVIATISAPLDGAAAAFGTIGNGEATGTIRTDEEIVTPISQVQGEGGASPLLGQTVTVEAIVVGDFQSGDEELTVGGASSTSANATFQEDRFEARDQNGFYLQQVDGDGNVLTSEGIFVFEGSNDFGDVSVGDRVRVTGVVQESFTTTQIAASAVRVTQAGALSAAEVDDLAVEIDLPTTGIVDLGANGYAADLERYEGMLVRIPEALTVTEQFNLDRFNEIRLFATEGFEQAGADGETIVGERPFTFTQYNDPDADVYDAYLRQVAAREIVYDDGLGVQNVSIDNLFPGYDTASAPRMGDTITNLTGVARFDFNEWRVLKVANDDNAFERGNGNPEPTTITADGTGLKVASFNVLNYFTTLSGTIDNGQGARGANNATEYQRQLDKLVVAIEALDSDIVGLIEIENDFGTDGNTPAVATLVDALNDAAGSDVWAYVDPGMNTIGSDAIAVAQIYRTDTVTIADGSGPNDQAIATLNTAGIFDSTGGNRVPLAVTYEERATGEELTVAVNHFKSKGSASPGEGNEDAGDGAGASNATRLAAAQELDSWLDTNPTGSATTNKVILGDLNSYASEDPIQFLLDQGWVDLAAEFLENPYGYVFDGLVGTLDYILASGEMFDDVADMFDKVEDLVIGNINADEADALDYNTDFGRDPSYFDGTTYVRSSDHDPLVASFSLGADQQPGNYTLQILHFSDAEASLLAPETAPLMAALVDAFEDDYANTLILAGGDNYIAGPFLSAGQDPSLDAVIGNTAGGRPDIAIHNAIGVEASAIGNHEFDFGPDFFDNAITPEGGWSGALFPYVSANLDFTGTALADNFVDTFANPNGLPEASTFAAGTIVPATVIEEGGERIGIIGATTQILERIANTGGVEVEGFPKTGEAGDGTTEIDDMAALAAYLQPFIDEMRADGINKIVLTSHLQDIANEQELATLLEGVDVILAAGSNTRLGDANDVPRTGEAFQNTYPITVTDAGGGTTLIVNTDGQYKYLGRLAIEFDADGNIVPTSYDPLVSGAYASTDANVAAAWGVDVADLDTTAFADGTKGAAVREITDAVQAVIDETNETVIGYTDVALNGERNPGVRSEETNLGNITADASIAATRAALVASGEDATFVVALKNGGGIRAGINAGEITQGEANAALAFDNRLMVFDATPQELLNILEFAADFPNNNGGFPQVGGLRFSYNEVTYPQGTVGLLSEENVVNVSLIGEDGTVTRLVENGEVVAGAPATIQVSVLNFTAQGGDGYPIKENGSNFRFVLADGSLSDAIPETANFTDPSSLPDRTIIENSQGEQQAFADYLRANFGTPETAYDEADTPEAEDTRIQNLDLREDTVFDGAEQPPVDNVAPTVAVDIVDASLNNADSVSQVTFTFSEAVTAFDANDIASTGGTVTGLAQDGTNPLLWTATFTADPNFTGNGTVSVGTAYTDVAGNAGVAGSDTVAIATSTGNPGNPGGGGGTPPVTPPTSTEPTSGPDVITGTPGQDNVIAAGFGADTVNAGTGNDQVFGNQDDDTLFGNQGNDEVFGGQGSDSVYGGQGNDAAYGNKGDDIVYGNLGEDQVFGNEGDDQVFGNEGNDFVHGGQGNDQVYGGQGNDVLNGGLGDDLLQGGFGSDVFTFDRAQGNDVVTDFRFGEGDRLDLRGQDYVLGQNNEGQATLFLEDGGTVVLLGLTPDQFQAGYVVA